MTARKLFRDLPAYAALAGQAESLQQTTMQALFTENPERPITFSRTAAGLRLDFSKHLIDDAAMSNLLALAEEANIRGGIKALLSGATINNTEHRPALHALLRADSAPGLEDKFDEVCTVRQRMQEITNWLNDGQHKGYTGEAITDVVNIGIGGSDLGPRLVTQALAPFKTGLCVHYVANVDPSDIQQALADLNPATTLFIICSKSFKTEETLANSLSARAWMLQAGASEADLDQHFLAVTTNLAKAAEFGISAQNCLPMWDWVGGRYSVWSAVGLSCAIAVGWERFSEFLAGASAMDEHFRSAPLRDNVPLIMSLLEIWYSNFFGAGNHVVLPYDHNLRLLPDFLQQLTMESNGKRVTTQGREVDHATAPVLWGSAGTMGQHSFHQLLHQGQLTCPADFILPLTTHTPDAAQHRKLVANCLAQSRALMVGRSLPEATASLEARGKTPEEVAQLAPHLVIPGNRPNSVITMAELNPANLGALLALYEHRTFCSGYLWGVNSFDQWGVELGKEIGSEILQRLENTEQDGSMDAATETLLELWRAEQR